MSAKYCTMNFTEDAVVETCPDTLSSVQTLAAADNATEPVPGKAQCELIQISGTNDNSATNLSACVGGCDRDSQCAPGYEALSHVNVLASVV